MEKFINRIKELELFETYRESSSLCVVYGRRRVGKTALIKKAYKESLSFFYSQAIVGHVGLQLEQISSDLAELIGKDLKPRSWSEFFGVLKLISGPWTVVLDEFPFLVISDPSLPSIIQKFIDHDIPDSCQVIVSGSSQTMMHSTFLDSGQPLFGRALMTLNLKPMGYRHFCEALSFDPLIKESFLKFAIVGGIPHYWQMGVDKFDLLSLVDHLYFGDHALLDREPMQILQDEMIHTQTAKGILSTLGRGESKVTGIAKRLGIPAGNLTHALGALKDCGIIDKLTPFGSSPRDSRKSVYQISDYATSFWFRVVEPHLARWSRMPELKKLQCIHAHAGLVLEEEYRRINGSRRYWEPNCEFDAVEEVSNSKLEIVEIKLADLAKDRKKQLTYELQQKVKQSNLSTKYDSLDCAVLDFHPTIQTILGSRKNGV